MNTICTPKRFVYLNSYAFLLVFVAALISLIPTGVCALWIVIFKWAFVGFCLFGALSIFTQWNSKKRQYHILMERNKDEFFCNSFRNHMDTPCGRLMTRQVLKDLRYGSNEWEELLDHYGLTGSIKVPFRKKRIYFRL